MCIRDSTHTDCPLVCVYMYHVSMYPVNVDTLHSRISLISTDMCLYIVNCVKWKFHLLSVQSAYMWVLSDFQHLEKYIFKETASILDLRKRRKSVLASLAEYNLKLIYYVFGQCNHFIGELHIRFCRTQTTGK